MRWIWEDKNWPNFKWDDEILMPICREIHLKIGSLGTKAGMAGKDISIMAELDSLLKNILKSSEIEGENLDVHSVRSSLARRLKIKEKFQPVTAKTEALAELQFDIFRKTDETVSLKRLYGWHKLLFPETEVRDIKVGKFRGNVPMQVVSGRIDKPKIHFEAPPKKILKKEMETLLKWFNSTRNGSLDPLIRAGIVHFWFVTIHPFEDGNGRLARILSELALAQYENRTLKLYSVSSVIFDHRKEYYSVLEKTQKGNLEITEWLKWFLDIVNLSISESLKNIDKTLSKKRFWEKNYNKEFYPDQKKLLNLMLNSDSERFENGVSAKQYQKINKVSKATATRHLSELLEMGCLYMLPGGGRSTRYQVKI